MIIEKSYTMINRSNKCMLPQPLRDLDGLSLVPRDKIAPNVIPPFRTTLSLIHYLGQCKTSLVEFI